ncbi:TetR/AcrR family transcriptional regulator [Brevibacterium casei]|nr:TetR/AcrR family transcriptional regulator [Brevibacterium casei]
MVNKRPGRPSGTSDARQRLVAAAQRLLAGGHPATITARQIAAEAGLSHSLVNYHFGSKDELLIVALALTVAPHHVVAAATEHGALDVRALAEGIVAVWDHPVHGPRLVAFARELADDGSRAHAPQPLSRADRLRRPRRGGRTYRDPSARRRHRRHDLHPLRPRGRR